MKSFSAVTLLALPLCAFAIEITSPAPGVTWNSSGSHTVTWTSVSTDPSEFGMYLVNEEVVPTQMLPINDQVNTSTGSFTFSNVLPNGTGYQVQFNRLGNVSTEGILAQSGDFTIIPGGPDESAVASVVSGTSTTVIGASTTGTAATGTSEAGTTGTAKASGSAGSSASGSVSSASATAKSSGQATYGSRGLTVAVGMIGVVVVGMFVVA